jgi:hypothetical protein
MNEAMRGRAIEGLLLMLGLILGGWILGSQIKATRLADRYVTVKGLVERNVKSNLAIWSISFKESGPNLQTVLDQSEKDKGSVLGFLKSQGSANQGVFSISAASAASGGGEGDVGDVSTQADSSVLKKIRVVTTVDCYLVK